MLIHFQDGKTLNTDNGMMTWPTRWPDGKYEIEVQMPGMPSHTYKGDEALLIRECLIAEAESCMKYHESHWKLRELLDRVNPPQPRDFSMPKDTTVIDNTTGF